MSKSTNNSNQSNQDAIPVVFEKINDNTGMVISVRNGERFTLEIFSLTDENITEIKNIREEINREKLLVK